MKVILREDLKTKGAAGDIIDVKPGYGRNYLIPQELAFLASDGNMKMYEQERRRKFKLNEQFIGEAEALKAELEKMSLTSTVKVGDDDKLFGSVTSLTVAELIAEQGHEINHRKVKLEEPIRELGVFEVPIDLGYGVEANVKVWVVKE